jgi:nucleoside 2-deoxyribosyltransferase
MSKKTVYIAGSITDNPEYYARFTEAENKLLDSGYDALSPAWLPSGLDNAQYMRMCLAMIDSADAVLFLPDAEKSKGSKLEALYCDYVKKPIVRNIEDLDDAVRHLYLMSDAAALEALEEGKKRRSTNARKNS